MSQKKVTASSASPVPAIKKTAPLRTTTDALSMMFRRGIARRHNKGKARLVSTDKTITKAEFYNTGKNFAIIYDHKVAKHLAHILAVINTEKNPKHERFYLAAEKLAPTYQPIPYAPKEKVKKVKVAAEVATATAATATASATKAKTPSKKSETEKSPKVAVVAASTKAKAKTSKTEVQKKK